MATGKQGKEIGLRDEMKVMFMNVKERNQEYEKNHHDII